MNILFIYPDFNYVSKFMPDYPGSTSLGLGYLSSALKQRGHDVSVFHITNELSFDEYISQLNNYQFDLIGFTALSNQHELIRKYAKWTKEATNALTIYGGPHPTVDPDSAISLYGIDMICLGEGEDTIVELCERLENDKDYIDVQSLWVKKNGEIQKNSVRPLRQNLDSLPFPDLTIFNFKKTVQWNLRALEILAARGCSFNCTYCCNHQYRKLYGTASRYVRFRSADNIIKEITERKKQFPELNHVSMLDDTFGLNKELLMEFCGKYERRVAMPWRTNTHAHVIDREVVKAMKSSGCKRIAIGIESGDSDLRKSILNRKLDDKTIKKAVSLCKEFDIEVTTYNMVGLPFETRDKILKTIKLNAEIKINPRLVHLSILQPYPKTKIYDICVENGFIANIPSLASYYGPSIITQPSLNKEEVNFAFEYFYTFIRLYEIGNYLPLKQRYTKIIDNLFLKSNPKVMLLFKSPINLFIFPIQSFKKFMMKYFPTISRELKNRLIPTYKA